MGRIIVSFPEFYSIEGNSILAILGDFEPELYMLERARQSLVESWTVRGLNMKVRRQLLRDKHIQLNNTGKRCSGVTRWHIEVPYNEVEDLAPEDQCVV